MKVLITTDTYKPNINGVVTSILNLKYGLEEEGHEVRILTLSESTSSYIVEDVYYVSSLNLSKIYPNIRLKTVMSNKEYEDIINWKPDIIHTQSEFSTFLLARKIAKKLQIPIVHTYHTMYEDYTHYFSPSKVMGKKIVLGFTNFVGNRVETIIAPTLKIKKLLTSYNVKSDIEVIPTGISLEKFYQPISKEESLKIKNNFNILNDDFILLTVSRVGKEKNIDELVSYMKNLRNEKITLVIVGNGPYLEELKEIVISLDLIDKIKFVGMIAPGDIYKYYQIADLFVSASTSETQGLTYIESLASGTPILCREDECLDGVLFENENGYFFKSEEEFLEKLNKFKELSYDEKNILKEKGKKISEKYSKEKFIKSILSIYYKYIDLNKKNISLNKKNNFRFKLFNYMSLFITLLLIVISFLGYKNGYFSSVEELQIFITSLGKWGISVFILIQIIQVIFPIIPGGISCFVGVLMFGAWYGFLYNYIGILMGSIIVFGISKYYGRRVVHMFFPKNITKKYFRIVNRNSKFKIWFAIAMFSPVSPADLLCYVAGTTKMKWKEYVPILIFGKPLSIVVYSMGLTVAFNKIVSLWR